MTKAKNYLSTLGTGARSIYFFTSYIYDYYYVALDDSIKRGQYTIFVGLYDDQTLRRVEIVDSEGEKYIDDEIPLSIVDIW